MRTSTADIWRATWVTIQVRCEQFPLKADSLAETSLVSRGCDPGVYSDTSRRALHCLADDVNVPACRAIWTDALKSARSGPPTGFHGDIARTNLLAVGDHRLQHVRCLTTPRRAYGSSSTWSSFLRETTLDRVIKLKR